MRFYYISFFSLILLGVIYAVGTGLLVWFGSWLRKQWKRAWIVMVPLFLLLYAAPVAEEFWIAWNFGQLCRKDAGIFITKTVEVDGYYDASAELREVYVPVPRPAAEYYDKAGYRFYELALVDARGGPSKVVHYEKVNGEWSPTVLDHPTARYHFGMDSGRDIGHKLAKQESRVTDSQTGEAIGEYRVYIREAPWYFIGLDRPNMGCDGPEGGPHTKHENSFLIYRDILKPVNLSRAEEK